MVVQLRMFRALCMLFRVPCTALVASKAVTKVMSDHGLKRQRLGCGWQPVVHEGRVLHRHGIFMRDKCVDASLVVLLVFLAAYRQSSGLLNNHFSLCELPFSSTYPTFSH
jgi:hypothetical protein